MHGFQLWANLPSSLKMTAPRYQEIKAPEIPEVTEDDGTQARIICGKFLGQTRPGRRHRRRPDLPRYHRAARQTQTAARRDHRATPSPTSLPGAASSATRPAPLAVPTESVGWPDTTPPTEADNRSLVLFDTGDDVEVQAGEDGIRFLLVPASRSRNRSPGTAPS